MTLYFRIRQTHSTILWTFLTTKNYKLETEEEFDLKKKALGISDTLTFFLIFDDLK